MLKLSYIRGKKSHHSRSLQIHTNLLILYWLIHPAKKTPSNGIIQPPPPQLCCCSVASRIRLFVTLPTAESQASLSLTTSQVCPISCPLHRWSHPAISSSDTPFSFCPQSFPASGTFPMSWLFTSDDQNTGASALASVPPTNVQG